MWHHVDLPPYAAQARADARRPRSKPGKIGQCIQLRNYIQECLERRWSPEQIAHQLRRDFPDDPEMRVTHETIYQALYVQGRGELRRELTKLCGPDGLAGAHSARRTSASPGTARAC